MLRAHGVPEGWRAAGTVALGHPGPAAEARPGDTILLSREPTTRPPFEAAWRDRADLRDVQVTVAAEVARNLPEYQGHAQGLPAMRAEAERALGER